MKPLPPLPVRVHRNRAARGFSLIEVLIALLVISFGLLGIAGMQAVSISNTGVASARSIAAMQGASLAAAMSANEGYWQSNPTGWQSGVTGNLIVSVVGSSVTSNDPAMTPTGCLFTSVGTAGCAQATMAASDLMDWGTTLSNVLPGGIGFVVCSPATIGTVTNTASSCTITIKWLEKSLVQNQKSTVTATDSKQLDYTLTVQP